MTPKIVVFSDFDGKWLPLKVVSAGLDPLCNLYLEPYVKQKDSIMEVFANYVEFGDRWKIVYRDDSQYGNDKGEPIRQWREKPILIFLGDGISDISAAKEADFVFAKAGKDLEKWCCDEGVPHITWDRLGVVLDWVKKRLEELG
ncbi:HAD-like domain-containing protein [Chytridium lagenaria]|nr:HAD-like domain-containing protein [Chytridium lagenaria]